MSRSSSTARRRSFPILFLGIVLLPAAISSPPAIAHTDATASVQAAAQESAAYQEALAQADTALKRRQWDEALRLYKRANSMQGGKSADALWGMAMAYRAVGAEKSASDTLDKFLPLVASDMYRQAAAYNVKGQAAFQLGRENSDSKKYADAESCYKRALELQPDMAVLHYNLGLVYLARSEDQRGIAELTLYIEQDPRGSHVASARKFIDNPRRAREDYAPDFAATTLAGERVALEDLKGNVVLIDFWATWCGPCVQALPGLKRLVKRAASEPLVVISVSGDRESDRDKWRAYIADNQMTWHQVLDARGQIRSAFAIAALPTYIVIDHEGIIRERYTGYGSQTDGDLQSAVTRHLKDAKNSLK